MKFTKPFSTNKTVHTHIYSETSHSGEKYPFKIKVHYTHQSLAFGEHYDSCHTARHKSQSSYTTDIWQQH
jgi:hypothetical protein